eukprot:TRINITY_DN21487_c0_g2_i1.p2 TRINITY_DN21487_c0_g2~~TRINITY_DN21487_c0_g2_i1.p2  ORF type:complete len:104 (-),score=3.92 TRINITY_DN21487_c0_g2_i1:64-375(-)
MSLGGRDQWENILAFAYSCSNVLLNINELEEEPRDCIWKYMINQLRLDRKVRDDLGIEEGVLNEAKWNEECCKSICAKVSRGVTIKHSVENPNLLHILQSDVS